MIDNYTILNGNSTLKTLYDIEVVKGENHYLYDVNDKRYLDLSSGLWNVSLGYDSDLNNEYLKDFEKIMNKNIPYLDMTSYKNPIYNSTANKIIEFTEEKSIEKVIFTNSGSETLELALKIVNATFSEPKKVLSFTESYHGTFYGGMSLSGITKDIVSLHKPSYEDVITMELPRSSFEEEEFIEKFISISNEIGAIFVEPIIGSGGIKFASIEFYNRLLTECRKRNVLIVFDEVATGFYKTGEKFFFKYLNITPDLICLSKTINNGTLPSGALLINENTYRLLDNKIVKHMSTQNGNLLCLSSINTTLNYFNENHGFLLENVQKIERTTTELAQKYQVQVRNFGSITAIPINESSFNKLSKKLEAMGIVTYRYKTSTECGLTLFPHINLNIEVYQKALSLILKMVKKYEEY